MSSFCLIICFCFYVSGRSVMSIDLECGGPIKKRSCVALSKCPWVIKTMYSKSISYVGAYGLLLWDLLLVQLAGIRQFCPCTVEGLSESTSGCSWAMSPVRVPPLLSMSNVVAYKCKCTTVSLYYHLRGFQIGEPAPHSDQMSTLSYSIGTAITTNCRAFSYAAS